MAMQTARTEREVEHARAVVEVRGVSVVYETAQGPVRALTGLTGELRTGEIVGLVGPNGSGKTTVVRAVTGTVRLASGTLTVDGEDVAGLSAAALARRIAVVPQTPVLPERFSVLDCVLMGRTPHLRLLENESASDLAIARQAMVATNIWAIGDRLIGEISGGERQRVVIARALAQQTPVLLLDEPTAHLDIGHQAAVLEMARDLRTRDGKAVLAIVHDLTLAAQYCDRLIMLHRGEVVAQGAPEDVVTPEVLREVYGTRAAVFPHPETGRPVVAPSVKGG
jgi:iron complex transport system ATP-binding protein